MLTKKQKKSLWLAGSCDNYTNEVLCSQANDYISNSHLNIKDEDIQEAIEIYSDGFYGIDNPFKEKGVMKNVRHFRK